MGARRALAAISHELSSPLTALYTFLRLARGDDNTPIRRCADRIQEITDLVRELSQIEEPRSEASTNIALAIESAASRLAATIELESSGELLAMIGANRASTLMTALLRAVLHASPDARVVARVSRRGDRVVARLDPGFEPTAWRAIDPWHSGTGHKLDLWAAAVAAGAGNTVRVGEHLGQIAVELDLPAAGSR